MEWAPDYNEPDCCFYTPNAHAHRANYDHATGVTRKHRFAITRFFVQKRLQVFICEKLVLCCTTNQKKAVKAFTIRHRIMYFHNEV